MEKNLYDLTNPQKSIWLTEQFYQNTNVNNICGTAIIDDVLDFDILEKAINKVVETNDSFRLKFIKSETTLKQFVVDYTFQKINLIDLNSEKEISSLEHSLVNKLFDLENKTFETAMFRLPKGNGGFIFNIHHIVSDSWTLGLLCRKVMKIYSTLKNNEELDDIEEYHYIDYINSESDYLKSEKFKKDEFFWNTTFNNVPNIVTIPSSNIYSDTFSCKARRETFSLSKSQADSLKEFCKLNKISLFNLFMASISIYLYKINNLNDFVVGTPILNRANFYEKNTTGMFVNITPFKVHVPNNSLCIDFIKQISNESLKVLRHQKYPYQYILENLRKKDNSIPNLYNILLSYQITHTNNDSEKNYSTRWTFNSACLNDIDIHIHDFDDTGSLTLTFDYKESKYTKKDISNLFTKISYIINQFLENKNLKIDDIRILSKEEELKILKDFNNTTVKYSNDKTIVDLFEEQVEKTPDNIALVFENENLTFRELNNKANNLAHYLKNTRNINRNDFVGIMLNRSMEMIISILATLKAGATYIPIDPTYPDDRINYMLKNSNAKILLTQKKLENKIIFNNKLLVDLDNKNLYNNNLNQNLEKTISPEDLAYVIFTSGSTGLPKGVMLKHKSLSNLTNYCNDYIEYLKNPIYQSIVSITTISFDIFIFETLISLQKGLKLIIANEKEQTDPKLLNELIIKNDVKIIQSTPSRMNLFINNINDIPAIKNLKYITLAGEQLPLSLVNSLHKLSDCVIYNGYGPSETTVFSTLTKMDNTFITIGKPLYNTQIYILDNNLKPVPIGISGELYISGDGVGKGYLNNKELTEKNFIPNPYLPNSIMYKTGDIGMYTAEGKIICLGRSDNQVKIRGLRIELGEIEDKINELSFINSCTVIKKSNSESHEFLCAYYTANSTVESLDIRKHIEKFLPSYMIPQYFVQLDALPYTPNGKIDRKKLPEPQFQISKREIIPPRNKVDSKIIDMLEKLLKISSISIDDSFFELGGDSLHAINLSIQIQNEFNIQLFSKDILENPIIKDLSDIISKKNNISKDKKIKKVPEKDFYRISSAQKRIYFSSQVAGNSSTIYNVPCGIIINGKIDSNKLEKCLNTIINRHESLRTSFKLIDENIVQVVEKSINFKLEVENDCNFENFKNYFKKFIKPFDLNKAPLFRAKLLNFTNGKSAILADMHHIVSDGASLSILTNELSKLYNDKTLTDIEITYKDFSEFEIEQQKTDFFKESEDYWLKQFEGEIPILNLPTTYSRPAVQNYEGKKIYSVIDLETKKKIDQLSKDLGITPYILLLSIYYILLSKYTSQDDIIIGTPIVGRDILETQNLIGMFVNTLALRNKINNNLSFKDFVLNIKEKILTGYKYQTYPFDELVNKLNIKRDTSRNPLFDTMFIYQNNHYDSIKFDNIDTEYYIPDAGISKFDLSLEALPIDDEIKLSFEYSTKIFSENFIKNLSNHYLNILNYILENTDVKIEDICMISQIEKNKILYEFNDTKLDYDKNKTISQLFEEQVEKTPNNIAVVFGNEKLTFKELNEKSNSLAHFLRNNGITKNSLVGIMINRSIEVIIAMLATIKAGGAYIPIDPTYPKDRINYMLSSSNAEILLTRKHLENNIDFKNKISIDLTNDKIYNLSTENLTNINNSEDLIYCIFTSGSTGLPKGVMIPHRVISNFTNYCNNYVEYLKNPVYDAIVSITTISFDLFVYETLISLQRGIKLIISNENEQTTPQLLNNLIEKNEATIIQSTPSIMQIFVNNIDNMPALKKIKYIILAGEQLPLSLVQALHKLNISVYNGYGPSETHYCTLTKMNDDIITIGKPICNSQMYILDKKLNPVPAGITGDIYISGDCVGKGYLNNKELTDKSFISNPFLSNTIMYKSGDLGVYLEDGNILCLGRSDHQIKIRGLRIELEEIESLILKYPNINKVSVVKQTIQNREFISAYFVASKRISISELRKHLSRSLPRYMIPSYYTALDNLPYTPNGKIDKKALPLPTEILNISKEEYMAPKTKLQKQLVNIFEKILNTKPVGINDNFFELGGDSLLAMNLNIELQKISTKITYQDIFRFSTVSDLEDFINSNNNHTQFSKIQNLPINSIKVLSKTRKFEKIKISCPKNILLTGATGFLGIHILEELLKFKNTNIYCIVRDEPGLTSTAKLHQKLNYYFGNKYDNLINNRIFAITGNISKPGFGLNQEELLNLADSTDIIINSAANVAHYGNYNDFYNSNVVSVKYIIDFCNSFKKKLYHISTIGVSGRRLYNTYPQYNNNLKVKFKESDLYIGQEPENVYTFTKFEAELEVFNAIDKGLDAYVLRMGHLMPRYRDGIFQENDSENAFLNKVASFIKIGYIPSYMLNNQLEFTPVDSAAKSICKLLTHNTNTNRIFHLFNHKTVSVYKYLKILKKFNFDITVLPEKEFIDKINKIMKDDKSKETLKIIIDDFDENMHLNYNTDMIIKSDFTIKYLFRTLFIWPRIDNRYLSKTTKILRRIL